MGKNTMNYGKSMGNLWEIYGKYDLILATIGKSVGKSSINVQLPGFKT